MGYWLEAKLCDYLLDDRYPFRLVMLTAMAVGVFMERERPSRAAPAEASGGADQLPPADEVGDARGAG